MYLPVFQGNFDYVGVQESFQNGPKKAAWYIAVIFL